MTHAIERVRVCEAIRVATCIVPDFKTREKTSLVWSKVYISIQEGKLCFIELNFFQRIIRYLMGSYAETIFEDKATLGKVKEYVHTIKTATDYDSIANILLEEVKAKNDYHCLRNLLRNCNDKDAAAVMEASMEILGSVLKEGFSKDFLSVAITLAKQNLEKDPEDKMWQSITEVFLYNLNLETVLNEGLLREVLGLPLSSQLPSQCIIVQDREIEEAVIKRLQKVKDTLEVCLQTKTLGNDLKILDLLEKIDKDKELPEVLRPYCFKIEPALKEALLSWGVCRSLVEAYLEDKKQIAGRLFYHIDLGFVHPLLSDRNGSRGDYINAVMEKVCANYEIADSSTAKMTWREQIGNGLFKPEHRVFADRCAKELELTLDDYFQWIEDPQSSMGLPELELLSKITGQPVIIVCLKKKELTISDKEIWYPEKGTLTDGPVILEIDSNGDINKIWYPEEDEIKAEWIDGINLSFDKEPIIFNIDNKENWSPVELKKK